MIATVVLLYKDGTTATVVSDGDSGRARLEPSLEGWEKKDV